MGSVPRTPCLGCRQLFPSGQLDKGRCWACRRLKSAQRERTRGPRPQYDSAWQRLAAQVVAEHVAINGPICPGWKRPPHLVEVKALTADHIVPVSKGGTNERRNVAVLCRSCNTSKHNR